MCLIFKIKDFIEFYKIIRFINMRLFNKCNYNLYKTLYIIF